MLYACAGTALGGRKAESSFLWGEGSDPLKLRQESNNREGKRDQSSSDKSGKRDRKWIRE